MCATWNGAAACSSACARRSVERDAPGAGRASSALSGALIRSCFVLDKLSRSCHVGPSEWGAACDDAKLIPDCSRVRSWTAGTAGPSARSRRSERRLDLLGTRRSLRRQVRRAHPFQAKPAGPKSPDGVEIRRGRKLELLLRRRRRAGNRTLAALRTNRPTRPDARLPPPRDGPRNGMSLSRRRSRILPTSCVRIPHSARNSRRRNNGELQRLRKGDSGCLQKGVNS